MVIGYVVSNKKINGLDVSVAQVDDVLKADPLRPILIVGWEKAKHNELYKSILDKQLSENLFWTFSKTESRSDFEDDLKKFYSICYDKVVASIRYYYVNLLSISRKKLIELCKIVSDPSVRKNIYIHKSMVYVPYKGNVLGVSLSVAEFCKVSEDRIRRFILSTKSNVIVDDSNFKVKKIVRNLENKRYAVPYLI